MSHPLFAKDLTELHISYSSEMNMQCWNKFAFSKFYPRRERDRELAPEVGHTLHTAYQSWVVNRDRDKAIFDMMMAYPFDLNNNTENVRSIEACYATLQEMINSGIFLEYDIATIKLKDGKEVGAVEVPFSILLKGLSLSAHRHIPIYYDGYMDMILYNAFLDKYLVVDIKTTRFQLSDYSPLYKYSNQTLPYALILETILGHPIHSLDVEYMVVYVDLMKPRVLKYSFEKDQEEIQDWGRSIAVKMHNLKAMFDMQWFPRNENLCLSFKKQCAFFDICGNRDPQAIYQFITFGEELSDPDKYKVNPWFRLELELVA